MTNFADSSFWRDANPGGMLGGIFETGVGLYGANSARKEAEANMREAQGPLYKQAMGGAGQALTNAGNMDPRAASTSRRWRSGFGKRTVPTVVLDGDVGRRDLRGRGH
jgi:uncharacterized protein YgiB involved in biofilm formation